MFSVRCLRNVAWVDSRMNKVRMIGILFVLFFACASTFAQASETTKLTVAFMPYRLGEYTTVASTFDIATTNGELPSPPTEFELRFPSSLNFDTSSLGLAICSPTALEARGLEGCSPNAQIGTGYAEVEVPIGSEVFQEKTELTALMGPPQGEQAGVLIYAAAKSPVSAELIFQGDLLEGNGSFGELLETSIPLVPSLPGAGDASITKTQLTIGPSGLTYYEHMRGKTVDFHPRGLELPERCPSGGFTFSLSMQFADGTDTTSAYTIPCSASRHRHYRVRP